MVAVGSTAGLLWTGGCGYYRPARGPAYAPWRFPDHELPDRLQIVHAGLLGANPHNTQPWWFSLPEGEPEQIELWADRERSLGAVDPLLREMYVGLGCAVENMRVGAAGIGRPCRVEVMPEPDDELVAARLELDAGSDPPEESLYEAIGTRHTNRGTYGDFELDPRIIEILQADMAEFPEVTLTLLTGRADMDRFRDATVAATEAFIADESMLRDSDAWFRHTAEEIREHRDGVTLDAQSLSKTSAYFAKTGPKIAGERGARYWLRNTERIHTGPCSAFALLSTTVLEDRAAAVQAGRAYQRLALRLEALGLAAHPLSQITEMRDREVELGRPSVHGTRLDALTGGRGHVQMPFRLGYAVEDTHPAPRRPIDWVTVEPEAGA